MNEGDTPPEFQAPGFAQDSPPPPPVGMPPTAPPTSAAPGQPGHAALPQPAYAQQAHAAPSEGLYASQAQSAPQQANARTWLGITSVAVAAGYVLTASVASAIGGMPVIMLAVLMALPVGVTGVVFGHLGLSNAKKSRSSVGPAVAGLIISYLLTIAAIVALTLMVSLLVLLKGWSSDPGY